MDTRFELNIKKVSIKGDDKALCLYVNGNLLFKFAYSDIETAVKFLLTKGQQYQLSEQERPMIETDYDEEE